MTTLNYIKNDIVKSGQHSSGKHYKEYYLHIYRQLYFCGDFKCEKMSKVGIKSFRGDKYLDVLIEINGGENIHKDRFSFNLEKHMNINKYNSMIRYFMYNFGDLKGVDGELW